MSARLMELIDDDYTIGVGVFDGMVTIGERIFEFKPCHSMVLTGWRVDDGLVTVEGSVRHRLWPPHIWLAAIRCLWNGWPMPQVVELEDVQTSNCDSAIYWAARGTTLT